MYRDKYTVLDAFLKVMNNKIGETITRAELIKMCQDMGLNLAESYIDNVRRQLTVCDYLVYTGKPGNYIVVKPVETTLTIPKLKIMCTSMYDTHKDIYIGNSKTMTDNFINNNL